ncbi:hypothetical protein KFK09_012805 [Dendrobium nobile]|uniref:Uncharacterized protein n=1 Tax=Dendrobium nobile TaxID=94219 RepID=A0A8T3BIV9_DENNO|nr:hypothetical protein KFK09_012805 [Dendrobium nobile]
MLQSSVFCVKAGSRRRSRRLSRRLSQLSWSPGRTLRFPLIRTDSPLFFPGSARLDRGFAHSHSLPDSLCIRTSQGFRLLLPLFVSFGSEKSRSPTSRSFSCSRAGPYSPSTSLPIRTERLQRPGLPLGLPPALPWLLFVSPREDGCKLLPVSPSSQGIRVPGSPSSIPLPVRALRPPVRPQLRTLEPNLKPGLIPTSRSEPDVDLLTLAELKLPSPADCHPPLLLPSTVILA